MNPWVTNASPLIFLAKLERLDLLKASADEVLVPPAVLDEIMALDDKAAESVRQASEDWLRQQAPTNRSEVELLRIEIGDGESEAIALAREVGAARVVLDDLDARRKARLLGLTPVGTIGLLLAARLRGDLPSLKAEIDRLLQFGFRVSDALVTRVLQEADEL